MDGLRRRLVAHLTVEVRLHLGHATALLLALQDLRLLRQIALLAHEGRAGLDTLLALVQILLISGEGVVEGDLDAVRGPLDRGLAPLGRRPPPGLLSLQSLELR